MMIACMRFFPAPEMLQVCLLQNFMVHKLLAPLLAEACTATCVSRIGIYHNHSTVCFDMFELKTLIIANYLSMSRKYPLLEKICPTVTSISFVFGRAVLQHNILIFRIIYNNIMVYLDDQAAKELENEISCHKRETSRGLQPSVH